MSASDIMVELVVPAVIIFGSALLGAIRGKFGKPSADSDSGRTIPPAIVPGAPVARGSKPSLSPRPGYGFTAAEEGCGYEPTDAIARAEAAGAGSLAGSHAESAPDHSRKLAAHRRRWRRALIDSVVIRPYDK